MLQAIVKIGSSQYLVKPDQKLMVDRLNLKEEADFKIAEVLLITNDKEILVGLPHVAKAVVTAKILKHSKGDKIRVGKFKAKSRYRKVRGFRASQTQILITGIRVN